MSRTAQHINSGVTAGNGAEPGPESEAATHAPENFTARAARWSAAHRKAAVLGWLAFVIVAFMIGNAAGLVTLKPGEGGNGQSQLADHTLAQQFPRERASEQVLIESRRGALAAGESCRGHGPGDAPLAHPIGGRH